MPGETAATILEAVATCLATRSLVDIEYAIRTDGGTRTHEVRLTPIGNDEVLAVVCDATERRTAEDRRIQLAVRDSEGRFRALVAESSDVIVILSEDALITYASPAFTRLLGYPEGSLVGTRGFDIIHPDDVEAAANAFIAAHTGQNAASGLQYRVRHFDGSWRWTESHTTNHLNTPGVNGYIVNARDITARHEANEKLEQAADLLVSVMGAAGSEAIIVTDKTGIIVAFSHGAEVLLGYSADDVLGLLNPIVFHLPEQVDAFAAERGLTGEEMFRNGPPSGHSVVNEWVFVRRDGRRFDGLLSITGRVDSSGTPSGFVGVVRDVTETRRHEAELTMRADHDGLTGLVNRSHMRALLYEAADEASWSNPGRVLLFIDLDHFKEVNDTYGHAAGDAILAGVADRLRENSRGTDLAARIGGDEFMVLLGPTLLDTSATDLATRIVDALAVPFTIEGTQVTIGASVGVATSGAEITPKELLSAADSAAYSAKHGGRGRVVEATG